MAKKIKKARYVNKKGKSRKIKPLKTKNRISGSSNLGWRIRDEHLGRKGVKGYGKPHRGGYNKSNDQISKWTNKKLRCKLKQVYGDS